MQDLKIDLVYLWVDGNDKEWQEKRNYWAEKLGLKEEISLDTCRYVDNQELKYSLRSAEMYAPWINKIFIITDNQVPKWLDTNHPKIRIVNHADIIPKANIDLVVMSTRTNENIVNNIISLYDYNIVCHSDFLHHYYRNTSKILNEKNYIKVKNIFSRQEDKDLFDLLFKVRKHVLDKNDLKDY